jgi:glucosamine--fructose-6-phosphate aminotransferase (isomerizing)
VAKFYIEEFAGIPVEVDYASEFRYRSPLVGSKTLFVAISQSGETADTLGSLELAAKQGAVTLAVCNVVGSTIARRAKHVLYTHAGPEISVASTKAFLTQLTALYLLALRLGIARGKLSSEAALKFIEMLVHLPSRITEVLQCNKKMERIAKKYGKSNDFLFLGRGLLYPIALEGALKLKEISYVHAEGYPAGEMKHGPISLINEEMPVVVVFGKDGVNYDKAMSNLIEVGARGGRIIAVTDKETAELRDLAWEVVEVGDIEPFMMPMVFSIPLQLLAYHVAVYRGTDVDQPRNLAKSVTVE